MSENKSFQKHGMEIEDLVEKLAGDTCFTYNQAIKIAVEKMQFEVERQRNEELDSMAKAIHELASVIRF